MNSMNINYNTLKNMSSAQKTEFTLSNVKPSKDDDFNLNQSIFKAYLENLKEKSDEATKKTLQELQNAPITAVGRLFGNLQVNSVEQVNKIFDDLRIKPSDEIGSILDNMRTKVSEQENKLGAPDKKITANAAEKAQKTDEAEKARQTDTTGQAQKADEKERFLDKYLKHSGEKLSKQNDDLNKKSEDVSSAAARLKEAIERADETGERDGNELKDAAESFVSRYNTFTDTVKESQNRTVMNKAGLINDIADIYERRLEKVGITRDDDGKLSLDAKKLNSADDKELEKAFGKEKSFADFIEGQAKQLSAYAQTDLYQKASAYNDGGNITQISNISGSYFNMLG